MFYRDNARTGYLYDHALAMSTGEVIEAGRSVTFKDGKVDKTTRQLIYYPIEADTEFQTRHLKYNDLLGSLNLGSLTISAQLKPVHSETETVYCHPDLNRAGIPLKYPMFRSGFAPIDLLQDAGVPIRLDRVSSGSQGATELRAIGQCRVFRIKVYCHFAVADIIRLGSGRYADDLTELCYSERFKTHFSQGRRLVSEAGLVDTNSFGREWVTPGWVAYIDDVPWLVQITVIDTVALHGQESASLAKLAANTGVKMPHKGDFSKDQKSLMLDQYLENFEKFDRYSRGDLVMYRCLEQNAQKFLGIYQSLGVERYYQQPKLTIGATIANLLSARIFALFEGYFSQTEGLDPDLNRLKSDQQKRVLECFTIPGSSDSFARNESSWAGLHAKVQGARAFNNRPTTTVLDGCVADPDLAGAYARSMLVQTYPLGRPTVYETRRDIDHLNERVTLGVFLKRYRKQFVPGLVQIVFSVPGLLPEDLEQDFFASYTPPPKWADIISGVDDGHEDKTWLEYTDETKVYRRQLKNCLMTYDGIEWLENQCSRKLKRYLKEHAYVVTAAYYPACEQTPTIENLCNGYKVELHPESESTSKQSISQTIIHSDTGTKIVTKDELCRKWVGVNLGELVVSPLLRERSKYPKKGDNATFLTMALNKLYKICCNTTFGTIGSRYFAVSNAIVGNNITGRCRLAIWCSEKGLYATQSITDGGAFDLNRVVYSDRPLNDSNTVQLHRKHDLGSQRIKLKPLGGYDRIEWDGQSLVFVKNNVQTTMNRGDALSHIDDLILAHMKTLFPKLSIWHDPDAIDQYGERPGTQFSFETKGVVQSSVYHGLTNYRFDGGFHEGYGSLTIKVAMRSHSKEVDSPAGQFLADLRNPHNVPRQTPFIDNSIVKVGAYRDRHPTHYRHRALKPGDTENGVSWIHELSCSNFLYDSREQRKAWVAWIQKRIDECGQSVESEFINPDGSLNYQAMVESVDKAISEGRYKYTLTQFHKAKAHPHHAEFLTMKVETSDATLVQSYDEWGYDFDVDARPAMTVEQITAKKVELETTCNDLLDDILAVI